MNWKEEGYKVGEKALIVREETFAQASYDYFYMEEVDIVHVGAKVLKIKRKRHKEIIETEKLIIKEENGVVFRLYKNKESYELAVAEKLQKEKLLFEIRGKLGSLNVNQLMAISKLIENK